MESQQHGKLLARGDSEGCVTVWQVPDMADSQLAQIKQADKPTSKCDLNVKLATNSIEDCLYSNKLNLRIVWRDTILNLKAQLLNTVQSIF